jgi:hypothetical protein
MADYNSSLPVRTENNGDVVVKVADATTPSQQLAVDSSGKITTKLNDGAGTPVTSQANGGQQALDVGIDVGGVQIDPRQIRALTSADVVTANQGSANTAANGWPVKPTDGTNSQSFTGAGEAKVDVTQPLPAGTNNIGKVSIQDSSGNPFSNTNPLFVTQADATGTPVENYNTSASLAAGATSNHDYTVTAGKTLFLRQFWASASGKLKIEIQLETGAATGIFNTIYVGFNSTANPNIPVSILSGKSQVAGAKVRIIRTNEDKASMDVYSTISGAEQ